MVIKGATISKGMTINLGDFNSHRVDFGLEVSFDDGEDVEASIAKLANLVNQKLAAEVKGVTDAKKGSKRQTLMEEK